MRSPATSCGTTLLDPLRTLAALDPAAARQRFRRMAADPGVFYRGALAFHLHRALDRLGADGPWVWSNGDAHPGNFATLAPGPLAPAGPVRVVFDLSDPDDEHPAPWSWDLLRALAGLAVARPRLGRAALATLAGECLRRYREVMARAAEDDGEHGGRVFLQDLPQPVHELIGRDAEDAVREAHRVRWLAGGAARPRLRRSGDLEDDPGAAAHLIPALEQGLARAGDGASTVLDLARRPGGSGLSSLGRRRWLALVRDASAARRPPVLRLLEIKELRPSALAGVVGANPFPPGPGTAAGALTVPLGGDAFQMVLPGQVWPHLVRTRCHARSALPPGACVGDELRMLVRLWATLLANAHLRGARLLGQDVAASAAAIADAARGPGAALGAAARAVADDHAVARRFFRKARLR